MHVLIIKLGATGDVVRTTPLLKKFTGPVTWVTAAKNKSIVSGIRKDLRCVSWEERDSVARTSYDLVINLEDTSNCAQFLATLEYKQIFGAYADEQGKLTYTDDSKGWFDLSLISSFGKQRADHLKLLNRRTYQDLIFEGLGFKFAGEKYFMPEPVPTGLTGDVAISAEAGPVWPMKNWAYFKELKRELESNSLIVNVLPLRPTLLEHLADVAGHRCLVSGDSLPMHMALGSGVSCVSLFTCTSPWEIFGYGLQRQLISPMLEEFFYKRHFDARATTSISLDEVLRATTEQLKRSEAGAAVEVK